MAAVLRETPEKRRNFPLEVITEEEMAYRKLDRIFRRFAIPFMLISQFLLIDGFLAETITTTIIQKVEYGDRYTRVETENNSLKMVQDYSGFLKEGDSITFSQTPILGVTLSFYTKRMHQPEKVNNNFKEFYILPAITFLLGLMSLLAKNRDYRLFGGAAGYILLIVFVIVLAIHT